MSKYGEGGFTCWPDARSNREKNYFTTTVPNISTRIFGRKAAFAQNAYPRIICCRRERRRGASALGDLPGRPLSRPATTLCYSTEIDYESVNWQSVGG